MLDIEEDIEIEIGIKKGQWRRRTLLFLLGLPLAGGVSQEGETEGAEACELRNKSPMFRNLYNIVKIYFFTLYGTNNRN